MNSLFHDAIRSRPLWGGVALMLCTTLVPHAGCVMVPFGLALALSPWVGRASGAARPLAHDLATIALFGSAAAATAALWPVLGRDPARLAQLLSELCHKGPELWGNARAKSPPEILNTLQGCVQSDRISQMPLPSSPVPRQQPGLFTCAFAVLLLVSALRHTLCSLVRRSAVSCTHLVCHGFAPVCFAHGRSPPEPAPA